MAEAQSWPLRPAWRRLLSSCTVHNNRGWARGAGGMWARRAAASQPTSQPASQLQRHRRGRQRTQASLPHRAGWAGQAWGGRVWAGGVWAGQQPGAFTHLAATFSNHPPYCTAPSSSWPWGHDSAPTLWADICLNSTHAAASTPATSPAMGPRQCAHLAVQPFLPPDVCLHLGHDGVQDRELLGSLGVPHGRRRWAARGSVGRRAGPACEGVAPSRGQL